MKRIDYSKDKALNLIKTELKKFDITQSIDKLSKEIMRNCFVLIGYDGTILYKKLNLAGKFIRANDCYTSVLSYITSYNTY